METAFAMSQDKAEHVAPDMLARFALGAIEGVDVEQIAAHLAICETCAAVVQATPLDDPLAAVRASLRDTEAWSAANASTPRAVPMPRALREQQDYVIEDLIGFGGMGLVYRARRRTDDRVVALKAIKPDLADDVAWRERFLRESTALRRFRHGNVVECHDVLDLDGALVIVMEYLEGQTLAEVVKADGKLDPRRGLLVCVASRARSRARSPKRRRASRRQARESAVRR